MPKLGVVPRLLWLPTLRRYAPDNHPTRTRDVLDADSGSECLWFSHTHPQSRVILEPDHLGDGFNELDTQSTVMVGAKGQAVISEAQPCAHCGPPAVGTRDLGVVNIVDWRLNLETAIGSPQHAVGRELDAVGIAHAKYLEQSAPALVEPIRKNSLIGHGPTLPRPFPDRWHR